LLVSPDIYETATYDFHLQPLATLFLLLAARDLWSGRSRRTWLWAAFALLTGEVAGTYLAGLGLSAGLAGRDTRRQGLALAGVGVAWVGLVSALGASQGSNLAGGYGYLAGRTSFPPGIGFAYILLGVVRHPG